MRYIDIEDFGRFVRQNRHERLISRFLARGFPAINCKPTRIFNDFSLGLERVLLHARDPRGHFELGRRKKDTDEAAHDHVVNFLLHFIETMRRRAGGNDGEVIGDFRVVKNAL